MPNAKFEKKAVFELLADGIEAQIREEGWKGLLPSGRDLANQHKVSLPTVQKSIDLLIERQVLVSRGGKRSRAIIHRKSSRLERLRSATSTRRSTLARPTTSAPSVATTPRPPAARPPKPSRRSDPKGRDSTTCCPRYRVGLSALAQPRPRGRDAMSSHPLPWVGRSLR